MPKYPSNFISGTATGGYSVNNVTDRREIKNVTVNSVGQGKYPTDQTRGTTTLSNPTNLLGDFATAVQTLEDEINAYQSAYASTSAAEKLYIANHLSTPVITLTQIFEEAALALFRLTADVALIDTKGTLGTSRYPSGQNRGY
jgi:hypothetical protein